MNNPTQSNPCTCEPAEEGKLYKAITCKFHYPERDTMKPINFVKTFTQYCFACGVDTPHVQTLDNGKPTDEGIPTWCQACNQRDVDEDNRQKDIKLDAQILAGSWGSLAAEEMATSEEDARLYFQKYGDDMTEDAVKHIIKAAHYANIYFKEVA